ncbi:MAG: sigma-54-dependent transcriptional regulator [Vicinamibacterales bacterium]
MTARLAVVDDDEAYGGYLQTLFESRGYDVDVYTSGTGLFDGLRRGPLPNVVLLDVMMPDVDGIETLRQIRQAHPSAQVVMLSGRQAPATIVEAVRLGAADYVLKPTDAGGVGEAALEAAIRNALERESMTAELERIGAQLTEDPEGVQPCWSSGRAMQPVMAMVERVADSDVSVLLRGESGVGKEVIARELLRRSPRRTRPFVKVNCAALPADLLESELFGHERGAFTGAGQTRVGRFEFAQHGTIMLDEIGEMPLGLQAKLLHVLQDGELTRLGSNRKVEIDVRVIAATNRDLQGMMRAGTFREDLYYRLQVIELYIPPLRNRREEIAPLVEFFAAKYSRLYRRPFVRVSAALMRALTDYQWPGNVRELENMMKRLVVLQDEQFIHQELLRLTAEQHAAATAPALPEPAPAATAPAPLAAAAPPPAPAASAPVAAPEDHDESGETAGEVAPPASDGVSLHDLARAAAMDAERDAINQALTRFRWNRRKTAAHLKVSYKTLLNKMKECGIRGADLA